MFSLSFMAAGCGSGGDTGEASSAPAAAQNVPGDAAQEGGNAPARAPVELPPDGRSIIYTGSIAVEPDNVNDAANATIDTARAAGGDVSGDNRSSAGDRAEATVTLRVPSGKFSEVMTALGKLGRERHREVKTEDVTEQVVDVQSRIATAQASVDRVRALLARATTLGEIVSLESEVAKREADLESLKARLNKLSSLAALSTITATFSRNGPVENDDTDENGFVAGLKGGWQSLNVLLMVLGALLPWFAALGLPALALVAFLRRTARTRAQPAPDEA